MRISSRLRVVLGSLLALAAAVFLLGALTVPTWSISDSVVSRATPGQIWAWYADAKDWPNWDHLVERVDARGPFADGTATRTVANGMAMDSMLRDVVPNVRYTEVIRMPLATMTATHELRPVPGGTRADHALVISGPGAWIYELTQRSALERGMDAAIRRLALHAPSGLPTTYLP